MRRFCRIGRVLPFIVCTVLSLSLIYLEGACADRLKTYASSESNSADFPLSGYPLSLKQRKALARLISRHHLMHPPYDLVFDNVTDEASIESYLKSLDKYSSFLTPEHAEFLETRENAFRIDMGLDYLIDKQQILAVPAPGGAAESAGLSLPAFVLTINDHTIEYPDFTSYRFLTAFNPGDKVRVVTRRPNDETERVYSITVKPRHRNIIMDYDLGDVGVIRIDRFMGGQGERLAALLQKYSQRRFLVLDLRYNPGGDLYAMADYISLLLPEGRVIAFIRKQRDRPSMPLRTLPGIMIKAKQRLFLLVSKYTASSAEIFTKAMRFNRPHTLVVGERTKGKCLAQERLKLSEGFVLELTTHEVIYPDMQRCEGKPLVPDIMVPGIALLPIEDVEKNINVGAK
jgi:carboxyl-terminal processing protease